MSGGWGMYVADNGVAYGNFAGIFIEAIKELKAQLQVEKSRNDRLEALMTTFNSRLDNVN
jgi:predicted Zn-dependent peptidase